MPHNRFFTDDALESKSIVSLKEKELQHLTQVMRGQVGDVVELIDGKGWLAEGKISLLQKQQALIELSHKEFHPPQKNRLIIASAIPLMNHLDFILEKGTELGADAFWLYPTKKSQTLSKERLPRLSSILIAAIKQSGQLYLPQLTLYPSLSKIPSDEGSYFFGDLSPSANYPKGPLLKNTILFVGPEGGYMADEIDFLRAHFGALGIKLNQSILRAETAAIAGCTIFSMLRDNRD